MERAYKNGVICGRFHNATIGHEELINKALKVCDKLLVFVGSADKFGTEKDPFKIETRLKILNKIYEGNDRVIFVPLNDLTKERKDINPNWGDYLLENAKKVLAEEPECMIYGLSKDEECRITGWFDDDTLCSLNFLLIPRGKIPISGTKVREYLIENKKEEWMKWVNPKIYDMYDELRNELLNI